jgi:3',5'-nucleoside bisphosphate phosphatase
MTDLVGLDLHVHTALSPCAANDMAPPAILLAAERAGVGVLGVVDHGTCGNAWAVWGAAPAFEVRVLCGLEVESAEGVHILALFDSPEAAMAMDGVVAAHLGGGRNRPEILGEQLLLDEWGDVLGRDERLLITATDLSVEEIAGLTAEGGGLVVPAHVDRTAYGLLAVLGFIPPGLRADLYEVTTRLGPAAARERWRELAGLPLVTGSDAHALAEVGQGALRLPRDLALAQAPLREWAAGVARHLTSGAAS